jgi:excisionase family DNA binding protein
MYYSTSEVAKMLGVSRVTVFYWIKQRKLKAYQFGRNYKIPIKEFRRFKEQCKVG